MIDRSSTPGVSGEHVHTEACRNTYPDCEMDTPTTAELVGCPPHDFDLLRQCRKCGLGSVRYSDESMPRATHG